MIDGLARVGPQTINSGRLRWNWPMALSATGIMLLLLLALYWPTALSMAEIWWRSDTFAHGMLVVPIVLYMIWIHHRQLLGLTPRLQPRGLWLIAALGMLWLLARLADIQVVQQLALVAMVPALVLTLLGREVAWALAFPLGYLFFAVPMGEGLVSPLQDFTAWFTVKALQLTGIPVYWEGWLIQLPSGDFEVAEACSGMRYLIASLALGCLYAYLTYRSLWRRLAFIAFSAVVPIIANGLRAYGIVMLAHLSDRRLAVGVDHIIYGWVFFGLVVLVMFWVGSWWREPQAQGEDQSVSPPAWTDFPLVGRRLLVLPAAVGLLLAGPLLALESRSQNIRAPLTLTAPPAPAGWEGPLPPATQQWLPAFQGADAQLHRVYRLE
ncbi:MAG: exosortase A, partial [Candidatus Competibacteraceae bacterium]|nr:exosortase A [Candidatus Competibacteraceae bacterium]